MKAKAVISKERLIKKERNIRYKDEIAKAYKLVLAMLNKTFGKHPDKIDIKFDIANEFIYHAILNKCSDDAFIDQLIAFETDGYLYTALRTFIQRKTYINGARGSDGKTLYTKHEITADITLLWQKQAQDMHQAIIAEKKINDIKTKPYWQRMNAALDLLMYEGAGRLKDIASMCNVETSKIKQLYFDMPCHA